MNPAYILPPDQSLRLLEAHVVTIKSSDEPDPPVVCLRADVEHTETHQAFTSQWQMTRSQFVQLMQMLLAVANNEGIDLGT